MNWMVSYTIQQSACVNIRISLGFYDDYVNFFLRIASEK